MEMTKEGLEQNGQAQSQQILSYNSEEERDASAYDFLWISERYYLQGICHFLVVIQTAPPKNMLSYESPMNCIFNDVIRLDFQKFKTVLGEHQESIKNQRLTWEEEHKEDNENYEDVPTDEKITAKQNFLEHMAKAAKFALNSQSWLQLVSILIYVWNVFSYDLTTPLELTLSDSWKHVVVLAECSLYLLEYLQQGGQLRKIAGKAIDTLKNQKPLFEKIDGKTVAFKFD